MRWVVWLPRVGLLGDIVVANVGHINIGFTTTIITTKTYIDTPTNTNTTTRKSSVSTSREGSRGGSRSSGGSGELWCSR